MAKIDMVMPKMGESIAEGTIIKWLKKEGDRIERDETILEISTDKVDSEIPSTASGVLAKILVGEGQTVAVGTVIAQIETELGAAVAPTDGQAKPTDVKAAPGVAPEVAAPVPAEPAIADTEAGFRQGKRFYSPLVRTIAKQENISMRELEAIPGSGMQGRVTKNDILAYLEQRRAMPPRPAAGAPAPPPAALPRVEARPTAPPMPPPAVMPSMPVDETRVEIMPMDHIRKRIAEHMVMSKQVSPHVYSVAECDMTSIVRYREAIKDEFEKRESTKLTYTPFFIDAVVRAIKDFPLINSSIEGDKIIVKKYINIGIAVALEQGLIVPVIKNTDSYNLVGLARATNDLANRARNKQLKPEEVQNGTFSITNMGSFGSLFGIPIINQPQVAILGVGAIIKRPVVINDAIAIRNMVYLSLSYDHRIIDGAYGGQFLQRVVYYLENFKPESR
ncbi:MAG: 2-oxo acid dehydrogenase subunit E2 [candidate division KSB1 bacterium]|nr:2-oxo acid dehydrogenase subunit E2 [candidate division KSB1 bacterium]MDZ7302977.1 2-oxo acid dehydrogenase subunit E2 [candidate division KSB1 bacterium]MDZ7312253.1 2-oxo acid dehydrogenase subunit E2 [candidate division KSB1 bacterium]